MRGHPSPNFGTRRSLRLRGYDYSTAGAYFVTIVTRGRVCRFGRVVDGQLILNDPGRMVRDLWERLPMRFPNLRIDSVVVMPNHVHGILALESAGSDRPCSLGDVVSAFKSTAAVGYSRGVKAQRWAPFQEALWQRNYFEHIIRDETERTGLREYITNNPARWDQDPEGRGGPCGRPFSPPGAGDVVGQRSDVRR